MASKLLGLLSFIGQDMHVVLTTAAARSGSHWCVDVKDPRHLGVEQV